MKVLNNIKAAVTNSLSLAKIKAEEINVSTTEVEITVKTQKEAKKLEKIFSREFSEVSIDDLSEIGESGFILWIRY